jgi:hypothetical protein
VTEYLNITNPDIHVVQCTTVANRKDWHASECGVFCLSKAKHVKIYSTLVWKNGGHLSLFAGDGRLVASWPSLFTGSFQQDGGFEDGLYARVGAANGIVPAVTVSFIEDD